MKKLSVSLSLLFGSLGFSSFISTLEAWADELEMPPVILGQGEQRLLKIPGLIKYSLSGESIRIHPLPKSLENPKFPAREILLTKGVKPGFGDLWVWKRDGSIEHRTLRVEKTGITEVNPILEKALSRLEHTEVLYSGFGVILRGQLRTVREARQVEALQEGYSKEIRDETTLSEDLLAEGFKQLKTWLDSSPYQSRLQMEKRGGLIWVHGNVAHLWEKPVLTRRIKAIFPRTQIDIDSLPDSAPTVHFRVFLLEFKKNKFSSLGLSWPAFQEGAFQVVSTGIEDMLKLDLTLQMLEGEGSVKILSNPELVVRAPGEAELFAGGELPIRSRSQYHSTVNWKNFGLTLKLNVTHSAGDRVRLDIFTEVSHLDNSLMTADVPGIQANRMKTQVDAQYGTPLLLSGLLQQGMRQQARGLPLLRSIPVLGALFGSEDYLSEKSELVAILVPSSRPPSAPWRRIPMNYPGGFLPIPRNWVSPDEEKALKQSPEYPWNVFQ